MTAKIFELPSVSETKKKIGAALQELRCREGVSGIKVLQKIVELKTIKNLGPEGYRIAEHAVDLGLLKKIPVQPGQLGRSNLTPNFDARYEPASSAVVIVLEEKLISLRRG